MTAPEVTCPEPLEGKKILDLGTGRGESAVYFALQGANVTEVDTSPEMIQFALRLAALHGVKILGVVCPAESLDVPSGKNLQESLVVVAAAGFADGFLTRLPVIR